MSSITRTSFCFLMCVSSVCNAQIPGMEPEKSWDLNGYIKYMATASIPDDSDDLSDHLIHQRFNFEYRITPELRLNTSMRNRFIWGDSPEATPLYADFIGLDSGYADMSKNWYEGSRSVGNSQLDRLYLNWEQNDWRLQGGRFRINWGMTTVWNPNDVFNSYSIYDFDYEERPGTDALSVSNKLGFASQVDFVFSPNEQDELNRYAGRYLFNVNEWDVQLMGGKSRLDYFVGSGIAGDIAGAGIRAELSYFEPSESIWEGVDQESSTVASIESDYSFGGAYNWILKGAILYISDPVEPVNAVAFLNLPLTAKSLSFTEHTTYIDLSFTTSPLNRVALSSIYYGDDSYYFSVSDTYSLSDNWQLMAVIQRFDGKGSSLFGKSSSTLVFGQIRRDF